MTFEDHFSFQKKSDPNKPFNDMFGVVNNRKLIHKTHTRKEEGNNSK